MHKEQLKGLFFGAVAAATYGMNPLFALPLYQQNISTDSVLFYRYSIAVIVLAAWMKFKKHPLSIKKTEVIPLIIAGLIFAFSSLLLFASYNYMAAGLASTILFVYPVMVAVIMAVFFKEKLTPVTTFSIILSLIGIALLHKSEDGHTISISGVVLVLLSALSYAVYIVGVNKSRLKELSTEKLTLYVILFGLSVFFVRLKFGINLQPLQSVSAIANALAIAILPTVISLICTAKAIHYVGATPTAILGALEPVTAVFFGTVIFHEPLTARLILGIVVIIAAVTLIVSGSAVSDKINRIAGKVFQRKKNLRS